MNKILIATHNETKRDELIKWLSAFLPKTSFVTLTDLGIHEDVEEDGKTFEENAVKKALFFAQKSKLPTIADDGGIEIDALGGKPGVHSKRWVGEDTSSQNIIKKTLEAMKGVPLGKRGAQMHVVLCFVDPIDMKPHVAEGIVRGEIAEKVHPKYIVDKFPYRYIFYIPELSKYYNHIDMTDKQEKRYNHRRKAVEQLVSTIYDNYKD